jgi:hypothetical protein
MASQISGSDMMHDRDRNTPRDDKTNNTALPTYEEGYGQVVGISGS